MQKVHIILSYSQNQCFILHFLCFHYAYLIKKAVDPKILFQINCLLIFYFSVTNSTFSPANIILVVRIAHILPHIEQVWRSVGGTLSK